MTRRSVTTGVTLLVTLGVLCVMAVWGLHAATAPIPSDKAGSASSTPTCAAGDPKAAKYLRRGDVTVSVYNAGNTSGRAQQTMDLLERAGFKVGQVSNAPAGVTVARAEVLTTKSDDPAAKLVALALGRKTPVVHSDEELGPGVDVVIGDKFKQLDGAAPKRVPLPQPEVTCK